MAHLTVAASGLNPLSGGPRISGASYYNLVIDSLPAVIIGTSLITLWPERLRASLASSAQLASVNPGKLYFVQGQVVKQSEPVSKVVRVRNRDTGETIVSGRSGADGRFTLRWSDYGGPVDVTVYDDASPTVDYNCKIFDMVVSS